MKKNFLKAVLLVITMMVGGTNSAWADGETVQITISEAGFATYCNCDGQALDFSSVEGLTAYIVPSIGVVVNLQAVKKIPAGTGVVVAGEPKTYNVPVIASADPVGVNKLIGVTSDHIAGEEGDYVLAYRSSVLGFFLAEADLVIPAGKAYLHIDGGSDARSFLPLNNETTGIGALLMNNEKVKKEIFSLSGQRVSQPKKGLYIIGGRKVVVK